MPWFSRAFFAVVAIFVLGGLWSTAGCTRRGNNSPAPPTTPPQTTFWVDPKTGSDTTGKGTQTAPYKTITKALSVVARSTTTGLTVQLDVGTYSAASGEIFPLVVPNGVSVTGTNYGGRNPAAGSLVEGYGEDTNLEKVLGAPAHSFYTTMEVLAGFSVTLNNLYLGTKAVKLGFNQRYASFDALGGLSASNVAFGVGLQRAVDGGIIVPSGTLSCTACAINGDRYAIEAFTVPAASAPTITLTGQISQSIIGGTFTGILTDGTPTVSAANQTFRSKTYAYADTLAVSTSPSPSASPTSGPYGGTVDFGSPGGSVGGNIFIGAAKSEVFVSLTGVSVTAYGNIWNANVQGTNALGEYVRTIVFGARRAISGRNVTVPLGSTVAVGPILQPTPTPTPYGSATPSPTPSPS